MECFVCPGEKEKDAVFTVFAHGKKYQYYAFDFQNDAKAMRDHVLEQWYKKYPEAIYYINCTGLGARTHDRARIMFPSMQIRSMGCVYHPSKMKGIIEERVEI